MKKIVATILLVTMILTLTACGSAGSTDSIVSEETTDSSGSAMATDSANGDAALVEEGQDDTAYKTSSCGSVSYEIPESWEESEREDDFVQYSTEDILTIQVFFSELEFSEYSQTEEDDEYYKQVYVESFLQEFGKSMDINSKTMCEYNGHTAMDFEAKYRDHYNYFGTILLLETGCLTFGVVKEGDLSETEKHQIEHVINSAA